MIPVTILFFLLNYITLRRCFSYTQNQKKEGRPHSKADYHSISHTVQSNTFCLTVPFQQFLKRGQLRAEPAKVRHAIPFSYHRAEPFRRGRSPGARSARAYAFATAETKRSVSRSAHKP